MWMRWSQRNLRRWWEEREVDDLRDHLEISPYETGIEALRGPGKLGVSIARLKRVWRRDQHAPLCTRCRLPWDALIEDEPRGAPLVVVGFDVVEAEEGRRVIAYRACVGGCGGPMPTRSPWSIDELLAWSAALRDRRFRRR